MHSGNVALERKFDLIGAKVGARDLQALPAPIDFKIRPAVDPGNRREEKLGRVDA